MHDAIDTAHRHRHRRVHDVASIKRMLTVFMCITVLLACVMAWAVIELLLLVSR